MMLGSIPSPPTNAIHIGDVQIRAYGLAIAGGVLVAVLLARRRWSASGGNPDDISDLAMWSVPAGLIGARLYHVLTDFDRFDGRLLEIVAVWKGGLGIPGGLVVGVGTGAWLARRRGLHVASVLDAVAPAIPVAQAIGRLGNWFNQELFGSPSSLPWAIRIDAERRPSRFLGESTFHPTFAYEALWNILLAVVLVWVARRRSLRAGTLFCLYVLGYGIGRLWVEALRIDQATEILGVRVNIWTAGVAIVASLAVLVLRGRAQRATSAAGTGPSHA